MSSKVPNIRSSILLFVAICYLCTSGGDSKQIGKRNGNPKFKNPNEIELLRRSKAADIKSWIEATEDPCNDFYKYACGNWQRIYADQIVRKGLIIKDSEMINAMMKKIENYIGNLRAGDAVEGKIRDFYHSCVNIQADACDYIEDLKIVYEEFGKFSFLKKNGVGKSKSNFNWWSTAADIFNLHGYGLIIDVVVDYDLRQGNETMMIYLDEPITKFHESEKAQLEDYMKKYFGASVQDAEHVVNEVLTFEKALSEAKTDSDESIEYQYSLYNLSTVHRQYRELFDVESFLRTALKIAEVPSEIYVRNGGYFDNLFNILENTKPDTVEDYVLLGLMLEYLIDVDPADIKSDCMWTTNSAFAKYLQHAIYQEFRSSQFEKQVYELWQDIKSVFLEDLQSGKHPWISTDPWVIDRLNSFNFKISSHDEEDSEEFFKDLQIDSLNYVKNLQNIHKHIQATSGNKLQSLSKTNANEDVDPFSAVYVSSLNEIRIPVAYLLPFHLWHPAYPKAILYANIGSALAHQMMFAFDDITNWGEERRLCFKAQYHNYTKGNGEHFPDLPEQLQYIADNSAVKIAYSAYMRWFNRGNHSGETFTTMSYSNQELFFISYAQSRCEGTNEDDIEKMGEDQLIRVIGALSNFEKFSEVFKCGPDTGMNPVKKCEMF